MLLTVHDLVQQLQVKPSTVYNWVGLGKIPHFRIYGLIRFRSEEIQQWLAILHHPVKAKKLIQPENIRTTKSVESLIAQAKQDTYNHIHGKPDHDRKEGRHGL